MVVRTVHNPDAEPVEPFGDERGDDRSQLETGDHIRRLEHAYQVSRAFGEAVTDTAHSFARLACRAEPSS